jgi:hypothetical protein
MSRVWDQPLLSTVTRETLLTFLSLQFFFLANFCDKSRSLTMFYSLVRPLLLTQMLDLAGNYSSEKQSSLFCWKARIKFRVLDWNQEKEFHSSFNNFFVLFSFILKQTRAHSYKTFYDLNLRMGTISLSVCTWQVYPTKVECFWATLEPIWVKLHSWISFWPCPQKLD